MRIVVIGTRGIPGIMGGVETHVEELYPRMVRLGHEIIVIRRKPYITSENSVSEWNGVRLVDVFAPKKKSFEAIIHTFMAVLKARKLRPDILHIHAIGPALMTPLARLLGMRVVMTHHGPDYDRLKWGRMAKWILRVGERFGARKANKIIVISETIRNIISQKYKRTDSELIYNGVNLPVKSPNKDWLDKWNIHKPYILAVGRFVKEKGFHDLIEAYNQSGLKNDLDLVIAGDADHPDAYSTELKNLGKSSGVKFTGFIKGEPLNQLMTNASVFVIPSYHEGLPITLLEAMSFDLDVLASDIPANRLPELDKNDFFEAGNIENLARKLVEKLRSPMKRQYDLSAYNWDNIAAETNKVYQNTLSRQ